MERVIVIGGSLGGLFAGNTLLRSGWDVTIVERSRSAMTAACTIELAGSISNKRAC
jgi:2-polyprenyl-6-methoxyphenol hydroxylase-like FAD-dependent oxidoreductase